MLSLRVAVSAFSSSLIFNPYVLKPARITNGVCWLIQIKFTAIFNFSYTGDKRHPFVWYDLRLSVC